MIKVIRYKNRLARELKIAGEVIDTVTDPGQLVNALNSNESGVLDYEDEGGNSMCADEAIRALGGSPEQLL